MDKPVTQAMLESGLISDDTLSEMHRWGLPVSFVEVDKARIVTTPEELVTRIREAVESEDTIKLRDTDLDIIQRYIAEQQQGKLHVGEASFQTSFCMTALGEYAIPWRSEGVQDMMIDEGTYLSFSDNGVRKKVQFKDVRELFFGERKAFMVCAPLEK